MTSSRCSRFSLLGYLHHHWGRNRVHLAVCTLIFALFVRGVFTSLTFEVDRKPNSMIKWLYMYNRYGALGFQMYVRHQAWSLPLYLIFFACSAFRVFASSILDASATYHACRVYWISQAVAGHTLLMVIEIVLILRGAYPPAAAIGNCIG